jgi:hypothetical protein
LDIVPLFWYVIFVKGDFYSFHDFYYWGDVYINISKIVLQCIILYIIG